MQKVGVEKADGVLVLGTILASVKLGPVFAIQELAVDLCGLTWSRKVRNQAPSIFGRRLVMSERVKRWQWILCLVVPM